MAGHINWQFGHPCHNLNLPFEYVLTECRIVWPRIVWPIFIRETINY